MFDLKKMVAASLAGALALGLASQASAAIVGVSGELSSENAQAQKVAPAPGFVTNSAVTNTAQEGFDENQFVLLASALSVDGGSIAAGTRVSSHMIFLNGSDTVPPLMLINHEVTWSFDGAILGVMSDINGNLEATSTPVLGLAGVTYEAPLNNRGFEGADFYSFLANPNQLRVSMNVTQPGDWIRVVTAAVPLPAPFLLLLGGMAGLGFVSRKRKAA